MHFGDWGTPMGMILAEIINQDGNLDKVQTYDIEAISAFYKKANIRCKEDEAAKETARQITAALQDGNPEYRKAWKHLREVSVNAVKKNYDALEAHFDLWLGESDAHEASSEIVKLAKEKGLAELDDGALIVRLEEGNKPKPPVILIKSDGGFGYQITDVATIKMRYDDLKADEIIYVVDKRQSLHFEQVFEVAEKLGIAPNVKFLHIGFGTVNGADGKPFKTRDGNAAGLNDIIEMITDAVKQRVAASGKNLSSETIDAIALAALKFNDLIHDLRSDYIFDPESVTSFEGRTGPYILYTAVRLNSILRKADDATSISTDSAVLSDDERNLLIATLDFERTVQSAFDNRATDMIANYAYDLCQLANTFYHNCPILREDIDATTRAQRLQIARIARDTLAQTIDLMGLIIPNEM